MADERESIVLTRRDIKDMLRGIDGEIASLKTQIESKKHLRTALQRALTWSNSTEPVGPFCPDNR